jgi:hypothetical protein
MLRLPLTVIALALGAGACASATSAPPGGMAGVAPMLSVERFLQAANTSDFDAMARIFGNADGSIAERRGNAFGCAFKRVGSWIGLGDPCLSRAEIELRMNAIALVVQHDDYRVRSESPVPGRDRPTTRVGVDIERGSEEFSDVPFLVVQTSDGRWLVEEIGLEQLTAQAPSPLDDLPEDTSRAAGMEEGDEVAASSRAGLFVEGLESLPAEERQRLADVGHPIGEVV